MFTIKGVILKLYCTHLQTLFQVGSSNRKVTSTLTQTSNLDQTTMDINESQIGELIIEGKTKQVHKLKNTGKDDLVYILSKDRITAGKSFIQLLFP